MIGRLQSPGGAPQLVYRYERSAAEEAKYETLHLKVVHVRPPPACDQPAPNLSVAALLRISPVGSAPSRAGSPAPAAEWQRRMLLSVPPCGTGAQERGRTGFEEQKDFPIRLNSLIAARYQVKQYLGSAAFSKAVQAASACEEWKREQWPFLFNGLIALKCQSYPNLPGETDISTH